jgi:hypothetical protein
MRRRGAHGSAPSTRIRSGARVAGFPGAALDAAEVVGPVSAMLSGMQRLPAA